MRPPPGRGAPYRLRGLLMIDFERDEFWHHCADGHEGRLLLSGVDPLYDRNGSPNTPTSPTQDRDVVKYSPGALRSCTVEILGPTAR